MKEPFWAVLWLARALSFTLKKERKAAILALLLRQQLFNRYSEGDGWLWGRPF